MDKHPTGDHVILYRTGCHWAILLGPMLLMVIGALALNAQGIHAVALIAFGLVWGTFSYRSFHRSEIALTRETILIHAGFPILKSYEIPLNRVADVGFYQPTLGSMLDFGKIRIACEARRVCSIGFVSSPAEFVTEVRRHIMSVDRSRRNAEG
jgi:hypothetical protein